MSPRPSQTSRRRAAARLLTAFGVAVACSVAAPDPLLAASKSSSSEGGRIYNPSRLRDKKSGSAPGRAMRRPPIPDPETQRPLRSTAKIPSPEPQQRGGSGYVRKGKYFYLEASPPELTRERPNQRVRATIPNPDIPTSRTRRSEATR